MSDHEEKMERLSKDPSIGPITQLPEFAGWIKENPARLESLMRTLVYPYGDPYEIPEIARVDAISRAITMLKQRLGRDGELREWLDQGNKEMTRLTDSSAPNLISVGFNTLKKFYASKATYEEAIEQLQGPQKTRAEQALKQLNKDLQPAIDAEVNDIIGGFIKLRETQELSLSLPNLPDAMRTDLETARDLCDLACVHLANRSIKLGASASIA
jgi:hypothetical protein